MNERDKLIAQLIKEKGGSPEDYLNLLKRISYHETGGSFDSQISQRGGGPGRGKYQFEVGKNSGAITAARRTKQYYQANDIKVPQWLEEATKNDSLDVTNLTGEQQDVLFLGNMRQHPKADLSKVWEGKQSVDDFWLNYHWAGKDRDRKDRATSFKDSMNRYNNEYGNYNYGANSNSMSSSKEGVKKPYTPEEMANLSRKEVKQYWSGAGSFVKDLVKTATPGGIFTPTPKTAQWMDKAPTRAGSGWMNTLDEYDEDRNPYKKYWRDRELKKEGYEPAPNQNQLQMGGGAGQTLLDRTSTIFNSPYTHSNHPMGGIPLGVGSNGKPNTVEKDEVAYIFRNTDKRNPFLQDGKFIFHNQKLT